jgi:2-polyprenyl-6-methoxyphenol hydroxylase-like FAD-dependent oxidoreductase
MRVLIVGGGIAGLSLAKALEQRDIAADLVERQRGEPAGGAGLYLPGNAARALDHLGLLTEVAAKAVPVKVQRILDWRGKPLSVTHTEEVWHDCGPCLSLPRNALHTILRASLRQTNVSLGKAIAGLSQSAAGAEATFDDGSKGTYDLVVGADGVNSAVRGMAFPPVTPKYVGNICWRLITPNTAGIDGWTVMLGNKRTLLALPVSRTDVYVYGDIAVDEDAICAFSQDTPLAPLFADFTAPVFPLIENLPTGTQVHFGRIEQVQMPEWVADRAVLIGDAAHASSPAMAEGAGMAMEDALILAESVATFSDPDKALAAYDARRRPRVDWVQSQCKARDTLRTLPAFARSTILKLFGEALYRRSYTPLLGPI